MVQDNLSKKLSDLTVQEFIGVNRYLDKTREARITVSIDEAAKLSSLSRRALERLIKSGKVKHKKIEGRTLILYKEFKDWLEKT